MKRKYEKKGPPDKAGLRELLAKDGRDYLLPLVNVFALAGGALDHIIDVIGRAAIEAVLDISAADVAGEKQPGKDAEGRGRGVPRAAAGPGVPGGPGRPGREAPAAQPRRGRDRDPGVRGAQAAVGTRGADA